MKRTSEEGAPYNGRAGHATRQPAAPSLPPSDGDGHVPDTAVAPTVPVARHAAGSSRSVNRAVVLSLVRLAATIILLTAGVALAGALLWPKTHTASAQLLFPITQEQPTGFLREDRSMTTQLLLIEGRSVLAPIAAEQGRTVEDVQRSIEVTVVESSEIIQLEVRDRSPDRALQTTQAVLNGYLGLGQFAQLSLRERLEAELAAANTALADAQAQLTTQQNQAGATSNDPAALAPLQAAVQTQQLRAQQLQAQLDVLNLAPVAQLLTPPYLEKEVTPQPLYATVTGALVGLLLAACVVAVAARSRTRE